METAYIQFQSPKSATKTETESSLKRSIRHFATKILTKVFPVANPDFENKIDDVEYWLVECDKVSGIPQREIGLDQQGQVIMKMPLNDNYGYWTDNNLLLDDFKEHFKTSEITKESFEQQWTLFDNLSAFQTQLDNFLILSTGADGGHKYISTEIDFKGIRRKLTVFFESKADEEKITSMQRMKISGRLMDEGVEQSLLLLDAVLIDN
jgi:hypothetical protein